MNTFGPVPFEMVLYNFCTASSHSTPHHDIELLLSFSVVIHSILYLYYQTIPLLFRSISSPELSFMLFFSLFHFSSSRKFHISFSSIWNYHGASFHSVFINSDLLVWFVELFSALDLNTRFQHNTCNRKELVPWVF